MILDHQVGSEQVPWRHGFDHGVEPSVLAGFPYVWDDLREASRAFRSDAMPWTMWYLTRFDDVQAALQRHDLFSSEQVNYNVTDTHKWIPAQIDPPDHTQYRVVITPLLGVAAMASMEPGIRDIARRLVDEIVAAGGTGCDFVDRFARRLPSGVFMQLLGLPTEEADTFLAWAGEMLLTNNAQDPTGSIRKQAARTIYRYLGDTIAQRRERPGDDVVSRLLDAQVGDRPITDAELLEICFLFYVAGMDTTSGVLSYVFQHLAQRPDHRRLLRERPHMIEPFVEECLRYYSIVATSRVVRDDVEFAACPMHAGDRIVVSTTGANRDPRHFPNADEFVIDRSPNRHLAFGAGIHRCVGAPLARLEVRIAVQEWLRTFPEFSIDPHVPITQHVGGSAGLDNLPLVWS
ncbi:MAG: cytochrome P450 [Actinomycetota bacterium]|nr:cytochrome P450 [Actinomycetota bacterium]